MRLAVDQTPHGTTADFIETLSSFSRLHRAQRWEGTFGDFIASILPANPAALARSSHEYIWDMLRWHGRAGQTDAAESMRARELFKRELFGIDEPLSRVVDYFKAAAAGSDVGRRLLLLLGPPSGGKSTLTSPPCSTWAATKLATLSTSKRAASATCCDRLSCAIFHTAEESCACYDYHY